MEFKIKALESVDSTNNYLKRLAAEGAPEGTVVIADEQTAGRGRLGRSFASPAGSGIYMSLLLRPDCAADCVQSLTAATAVAVCRAIDGVCGTTTGIKWVNDVCLSGRKLCGILCESTFRDDRTDWAVVGIGLNVTTRAEDFPEELRDIAGSLFTQTGRVFERSRLVAAILKELGALYPEWLASPSVCLDEYRRRCVTLGREVTVKSPQGDYAAEAIGIAADYGLIIRFADGETRTLRSGEVKISA